MMTTGRADFYAKAHGVVMRNLLTRHLEAVIASPASPPSGDGRIAAILGYGAPYRRVPEAAFRRVLDLREYGESAKDAPQGRSAVVDAAAALPVASKSLDLLMVVHGHNRERLAEYARVLDDHGRLVLVAPCRSSKKPPFGGEAMYSARGLRRGLESHGFEVAGVRRALVLPIFEGGFYCRFAGLAEKPAWLPYRGGVPRSGVVIVDARKMIYAVKGLKTEAGLGRVWAAMTPRKRATIG